MIRDKRIINLLEKFLKLVKKTLIFALMYSILNVEFAQLMLILLSKFRLYENYFDSKNVKILFTHENKDFVIKLKFNKESLYDLFYMLS